MMSSGHTSRSWSIESELLTHSSCSRKGFFFVFFMWMLDFQLCVGIYAPHTSQNHNVSRQSSSSCSIIHTAAGGLSPDDTAITVGYSAFSAPGER